MQGNQLSHNELAEAHVDWYLKSIRPLLIDNFVHGVKHGLQMAIDMAQKPNTETRFCNDRGVYHGE